MRKNVLYLMGFVIFLGSCLTEEQSTNPIEITRDYVKALNKADLNHASEFVCDGIIFSEMGIEVLEMKEDLFELNRWDITFSPEFEILEIYEKNGYVETVMSKNCVRIQFLQDRPMIYNVRFEFSKGKINKIDTYEYLQFDVEKWEPRRDALVKWIDDHHPELSGFIYDQTEQGALNYLKAIELYNGR